jgi:hypothetical protein
LDPITILDDGTILDGRNRQRACDRLGKPVVQVRFAGLGLGPTITPEEYIWSKNVQRRHLTDDQRSTIQMKWKPQLAEEGRQAKVEGGKSAGVSRPKKVMAKTPEPISPKPTTRKKLAEQAGVSEHKIRQAETVAKHAPELMDDVIAGKLPLAQAVKQAAILQTGPIRLFPGINAPSTVENPAKEFNPTWESTKLFNIVSDRVRKLRKDRRPVVVDALIERLGHLRAEL